MISFDEFLKQDDEEKYNNMQFDIFEIQALKNELENRDIYISKLEVAYSKEIERLNNIINELEKYINETKLEEFEKEYGRRYGKTFTQAEVIICNMILNKLQELKGSKK